jgi:hypothetical protein
VRKEGGVAGGCGDGKNGSTSGLGGHLQSLARIELILYCSL